jgi:hypothetical protein
MIRSRVLIRVISALVLVATTLSSCSTVDAPTAPAPGPEASSLQLPVVGGLLNGLLACDRQPYARTVQVVGPLGGTIQVGKHRLTIPMGALSQPVTITAEAPSDLVASVRFSPEGLRFGRPATVTLDYSSCPLGRLRLLKRVAYTTERLEILSYLLSRDNLLLMRVSGELEHFSRYAVAW